MQKFGRKRSQRHINRICRVATAARSLTVNNELTVEVDKLKLLLSKGSLYFIVTIKPTIESNKNKSKTFQDMTRK